MERELQRNRMKVYAFLMRQIMLELVVANIFYNDLSHLKATYECKIYFFAQILQVL